MSKERGVLVNGSIIARRSLRRSSRYAGHFTVRFAMDAPIVVIVHFKGINERFVRAQRCWEVTPSTRKRREDEQAGAQHFCAISSTELPKVDAIEYRDGQVRFVSANAESQPEHRRDGGGQHFFRPGK